MTGLEERKTLIDLISEATLAGARQAPACEMLGLSARTVQRWRGECNRYVWPFNLDVREMNNVSPNEQALIRGFEKISGVSISMSR